MTPVIDLLSAHRSVRKFTDRPVDEDILKTIVRAGQCASTSHHVQAWSVIHVTDRGNKKAISELAGPQPWVASAPVFLVWCADLTRLEAACEQHGLTAETGWAEQLIVATVDTALAAQNAMAAAESLGLGGVFIGGIRNDPERVCNLLEIPDLAYPVFGMCLGYPDQSPEIKPRLPVDLVLKTDTFRGDRRDQDAASMIDAYDRQVRDYYLNRNSNVKERTWTGQMARFTAGIVRPHMKGFLEKQGFFIK